MRELVRLRQRFIIILMSSVGLVLTVALVLSTVSSFSSQYARIQNSLSAAITIESGGDLRLRISSFAGGYLFELGTIQEAPPNENMPFGSETEPEGQGNEASRQETLDMVPVYVVDISGTTGEIANYGNSAEMDDTVLSTALERVKASTDTDGLLFDLGLFYMQKELPTGTTRVAFADASHIFDNTLQQAFLSLLIWLGAMVAFFVLSLILSRMVLKPVESAWIKQREFIADASHELKTPLTIILANTNIVMSHPEKSTAQQQQWLESTQDEANRMNELVSDLLLLAQVEHEKGLVEGDDSALSSETSFLPEGDDTEGSLGATAAARTVLDLSALVERALLQFDVVFFERGISSTSEIEKGLSVLGNPDHLRRLINILLDNASKYGNKGGVVEVRLQRQPHKANALLLTVSNTGALIPADKIGRIFDRFYRGDTSHSSIIPGSGLGLALAQEIVQEHGGSISVESKPLASALQDAQPGEEVLAQTTFSITLPLAKNE